MTALSELPALVRLDLGEQAYSALVTWRKATRGYEFGSKEWFQATWVLCDAADRIEAQGAAL